MALPPVIPSTQDAGSWMQHQTTMLGPVGYAAPPSPHAPAADNEPERAALIASLRTLLEQANGEVKEARSIAQDARAELKEVAQDARAELKEARAELKEAREEAKDAKIAEIRREHSEMRLNEKYHALWREMYWRRDGWRD